MSGRSRIRTDEPLACEGASQSASLLGLSRDSRGSCFRAESEVYPLSPLSYRETARLQTELAELLALVRPEPFLRRPRRLRLVSRAA